MNFKKYDPLKDIMYQVLDKNGNLTLADWDNKLNDMEAKTAYEKMLFARQADIKAVSYQRQGRMYTYPPNLGQEAIAVAAGMVIRDEDWLVPAFRELGTYLAKGMSLKEYFLYFRGHEDSLIFKNAKNFLPFSVPIASQLLHAVGIGYAIKYKEEKDKVVFTFVGDGGTSEGDFHEAMNFAAVWKVPVIFIVQNNQFAISVPFNKQTASVNIAAKSVAYGMPGIKVDGNDIFAMYDAVQTTADYAGKGNGPVLIEALTFRAGAHTTSDDPSKYRTKEEEDNWAAKDPLLRLKKYLQGKDLWNAKEENALLDQYDLEIERQFEEAENYPTTTLDEVFDYHYEELPEELNRQKVAYKKFLNWKETRK
ncbi:MAG: pyruvate dehydrogenase (acetyl-transferring) E1 component subunit alpha [Spirochaetia bacterium]|nr:pyruvate dehydrogenase (acetyl-transferring) E1 component subunit alpha [Spirochaetia bacterium]